MLKDAGASAVIADIPSAAGIMASSMRSSPRRPARRGARGCSRSSALAKWNPQRSAGDGLSISVPTGMTEADLAMGYEPLWAIGSGRVPTSQEIMQMHAHVRECLVVHLGPHGKNVRILYGSSVNLTDARAILALPGVGAALVGGAKLKTGSFWAILASTPSTSTLRLDVA